MNDARAISAQLVDIRNVGTHKVVKLTLHAPEEHAMHIMEMFGWPTGVNPVPVALARLSSAPQPTTEEAPRPEALQSSPAGEITCVMVAYGGKHCVGRCMEPRDCSGKPLPNERKFEDVPRPQQAGMLCSDEAFQRFLSEEYHDQWLMIGGDDARLAPAVRAKVLVCNLCKVMSRADITAGNAHWSSLVLAYRLWQRHPELSDAS